MSREQRRRLINCLGYGGAVLGFASVLVGLVTRDPWAAFYVWCLAWMMVTAALFGIARENIRDFRRGKEIRSRIRQPSEEAMAWARTSAQRLGLIDQKGAPRGK